MDEARVRIEKLLAVKNYEGIKHELQVFPNYEFTNSYYILYIKCMIKTQEYEKALQFCNVLIEKQDSELTPLINYQVYKLYLKLKNKEKALQALKDSIENVIDEKLRNKYREKLKTID